MSTALCWAVFLAIQLWGLYLLAAGLAGKFDR